MPSHTPVLTAHQIYVSASRGNNYCNIQVANKAWQKGNESRNLNKNCLSRVVPQLRAIPHHFTWCISAVFGNAPLNNPNLNDAHGGVTELQPKLPRFHKNAVTCALSKKACL